MTVDDVLLNLTEHEARVLCRALDDAIESARGLGDEQRRVDVLSMLLDRVWDARDQRRRTRDA